MDQQTFYLEALVYLSAAVLLVPVAKKAGLGSILGYILAGVLIGPAALNLVTEKGSDVMHVAEFGVVMMLFVIGLELEPSLLWKLRKSIVGMGGLQILLTIFAIAGIAVLLGNNVKLSLAIGMIVASSSTAIVLQTLQEKGYFKTEAGQGSFSVLLFQDIAVIPMLAILPLLSPMSGRSHPGHNNWVLQQPGWLQTLIMLGTVAAIFFAGRYLVRPFLRIVASSQVREVFTATTLLLVVGITLLMTQVGLSPALGAFLAGVVLANSEFRHELKSDIEPFKGLLLGLFFIAVGITINFRLIVNLPWLVFGLVAGIMAVKALVLFCVGRLFRLNLDQNLFFSLALCQVGEFAFVLLSFSRQENIIPANTTDLLMASVAISMALTPLLFLLYEKVIQRRFGVTEPGDRKADAIPEKNPVIIAGFGDFGNTVGRFLKAHDIGTTILDIDSDRVDFLRKIGFKVYYGDASRRDLLEAAGADEALVILITIDDPQKRLEMIETIKKHFPRLKILVRTRSRNDAYDQMNAGMLNIYRETLDAALRMGIDTMKMLGFRTYSSFRAAQTFRSYDEKALKKLSAIRDQKQYINTSREFIEELEKIIQSDRSMRSLAIEKGWEEEGLIRESPGD
ncbi:monovalent cation:proton antiporter-2 (CPA2) family protein [Flavihumibacter solisilvae]|uniref:Potassium transporter n=1 Tax=Flavihumibacter solisilvae TaxID=1349421 RepID=A0A0C1II33_9BACT|nr:monovalent cation:proton antiporter-2 (CPA2) family protein [Flavihumibacter solisilvae]KIC93865.1 potassium transporter [Flavihumibacter solisilvae]